MLVNILIMTSRISINEFYHIIFFNFKYFLTLNVENQMVIIIKANVIHDRMTNFVEKYSMVVELFMCCSIRYWFSFYIIDIF
jgi:hypothetical protein